MSGDNSALTALPRQGGKTNSMAVWVNGHLPMRTEYVEPFCGMLGVLLNREPSRVEIANDRDELLGNWWRHLQSPSLLRRLIRATEAVPWARAEWRAARRIIDDPAPHAPLDRAVALQVLHRQSFGGRGDAWHLLAARQSSEIRGWPRERWAALAARVEDVCFECRGAIAVIRSVADRPDCVVYVDPPYADTDAAAYRVAVDYGALREALLACKCLVAVSGFGGEWDCLAGARRRWSGAWAGTSRNGAWKRCG